MTRKPFVVALVQGRMGSTRLPGKVLMDIAGKPMLAHHVERIAASKCVGKVVVATSKEDRNTPIEQCATAIGVDCYRGSEVDLIDRLYQAAKLHSADAILRITADCPLVDPDVVDQVIEHYWAHPDLDVVWNCWVPTYPHGLDVKLYSIGMLKRLWEELKEPFLREWVDTTITDFPERFNIGKVSYPEDLSHHRWTVDYAEDLQFVREVYGHLYQGGRIFRMKEILTLLETHPELTLINGGHDRHEGLIAARAKSKEQFVSKGQ